MRSAKLCVPAGALLHASAGEMLPPVQPNWLNTCAAAMVLPGAMSGLVRVNLPPPARAAGMAAITRAAAIEAPAIQAVLMGGSSRRPSVQRRGPRGNRAHAHPRRAPSGSCAAAVSGRQERFGRSAPQGSALPVALASAPAVAVVLPVVRHPAVALTRGFPVTSEIGVTSAFPEPAAADPEIPGVGRDPHRLVLHRRRLLVDDLAVVARPRCHDAARQRHR